MSRSPAVVAAGLFCAAGKNAEESFCAAVSGRDGLEKVSLFESPRHGFRLAAQAHIKVRGGLSRCAEMLFRALDEAMSRVDLSALDPERIALRLGTSVGGIFETENMLSKIRAGKGRNLAPLSRYECSDLAFLAAKRAGARGEVACYSTACSSSSLALSDACNAIAEGSCDAVFVCGVDALSRMTLNGFGSLLLLSGGKCAPFDAKRDGINLGEAAAVLIVCSEGAAKKIGAKAKAHVSGWGCSCDAYHPTAPHPSGEGAARAFAEAARKAGLSGGEISCYNAHGTATAGNDVAEGAALIKFFGKSVPPFSSLKRIFGHTLGASGAVNAAMSVATVESGVLPKNSGYENFDEKISLAPASESAKLGGSLNVLSASLGFGGNNGAAVFSSEARPAPKVEPKKLFVYGMSVLGGGGVIADENLLSDIPPLKKRKLSHHQKMAVEAARTAARDANSQEAPERVCVCWGSGLGMTERTAAFVENLLEKNEAEPMPSAFANSVHNAAASAISLYCGFKGLNSAATAKEVSFECALAQARREIFSGACDAALVGASDEYSPYAAEFLDSQHARYSRIGGARLSDFAAAYFLGLENSCSAEPIAEILAVSVGRERRDFDAELERLAEILSRAGLGLGDISRWTSLEPVNEYGKRRLGYIGGKLGGFSFPLGECGAN